METLGERLRFIRKQKGYSESKLGESIGYTRGVITNLERCDRLKNKPKDIYIKSICDVLNINEEWLLSGTGEMDRKEETEIIHALLNKVKTFSKDEMQHMLDYAIFLKSR